MSWISNLAHIYDKLYEESIDGEGLLGGISPISTNSFKAQLEIVLSDKGELLRGHRVHNDDSMTLTPVTENSSSRSGSKIAAHPIFDNLGYIAGDLHKYSKNNSKMEEKFDYYIEQLREWKKYESDNEYLAAVYSYLNKKTLASDLINKGLLTLDEQGFISEVDKHQNNAQEKFFTRIAVEKEGRLIKLWEEKRFFDSYSEYSLRMIEGKNVGICFVTGMENELKSLHSKYIRFPGDGAKLISSNDSSNFTYRGRFRNPGEAYGIGYEESEKAHIALRWLINKQAYRNNEYVVLAFGTEPGIPHPFEDSEVTVNGLYRLVESHDHLSPYQLEAGGNYAKDLKMAIKGYSSDLDKDSNISLIALDSATPGRMAILYYREMSPGDYYDNITYYHNSMSWEHRYKKDGEKRIYPFIGVPRSSDLIDYVFGVERSGIMSIGDRDKYKNQLLQRLLPCITERAPIPRDFVEKSIYNAVTPLSKSNYNWQRCIAISCGLIKKYYLEKKEVELSMALDKKLVDRSYLYGRLLAAAEKIERDALFKEGSGADKRQTNAMRYMNILSKKPYTTWINVEKNIQPYLKRLPRYQREYYQKIIGEIMDLFETEEFIQNKNLEGTFVLGFHCQLQDFYKKSNTEDN